jgi:hypothetical protein
MEMDMNQKKLFKILNEQGHSFQGGYAVWNLPRRNTDGTWTPGEWMPEVEGALEFCKNGYHLAREKDLPMWLGPAIYEAEVFGEVLEKDGENKVVARCVRLTRRLNWDERIARMFACWCVRQVWHLLDDDRSRKAVETAERFANGEATLDELDAAREAAWKAAREAAREAARYTAPKAARDAAREDAWEAAQEAAREAAWAAARYTAPKAARDAAREDAWEAAQEAAREAAWAAAWDASGAAVWDASGAAAWEVARDAARAAQTAYLIKVLYQEQEQS